MKIRITIENLETGINIYRDYEMPDNEDKYWFNDEIDELVKAVTPNDNLPF